MARTTCSVCGKPATVHLTEIIKGQKREVHLCDQCAREQDVTIKTQFTLPDLLQGLISAHLGGMSEELASLCCPSCGMKYMEFRGQGRLGCPNDYRVFAKGLTPLMERIHGATRHVGKVPRQAGRDDPRRQELAQLRQQLRDAVKHEAYEEAARLRDIIREKEATP